MSGLKMMTQVNCAVVIGNMCGGKYELYEDKDFIDCTHDVVAAAQFVAEGWEAYE